MPSSLQTHQVSAEGREEQPAAHGEEHRDELELQPEGGSDPLEDKRGQQAGWKTRYQGETCTRKLLKVSSWLIFFSVFLQADLSIKGGAVGKGNAVLPQLQRIPPWINQAVGSEFPLPANPCPACSGYSCLAEISSRIMP